MVNLWVKKLCSVDFNKGAILGKNLVNILAQHNFSYNFSKALGNVEFKIVKTPGWRSSVD